MNRPKEPKPVISYYAVLDVPRTASVSEIKKAYRKMAFENHPDRGGGKAGEEMLKRLNCAKDILLDPNKRRSHDRELDQYARLSDTYQEELRAYQQWKAANEARKARIAEEQAKAARAAASAPSRPSRPASTDPSSYSQARTGAAAPQPQPSSVKSPPSPPHRPADPRGRTTEERKRLKSLAVGLLLFLLLVQVITAVVDWVNTGVAEFGSSPVAQTTQAGAPTPEVPAPTPNTPPPSTPAVEAEAKAEEAPPAKTEKEQESQLTPPPEPSPPKTKPKPPPEPTPPPETEEEEVDRAQEFVNDHDWLDQSHPDRKVVLDADKAYSIGDEYLSIQFNHEYRLDSMALMDQSVHGPSGGDHFEFAATNYSGSDFTLNVPTSMSVNQVLSFLRHRSQGP